jgi:hypothetical protein
MTWKRLTSTSIGNVDINLDHVAYIDRGAHGATIYFAVPGAVGKLVSLSVKESPDGIHAAPTPAGPNSADQ